MKTRLLTAAVGLPLLFAAIILPFWVPGTVWIFVGLAVLALAAGLFEFFSLTKKMELKADAGLAYIGSAIFVFAFAVDAPSRAPELLVLIAALFVMGPASLRNVATAQLESPREPAISVTEHTTRTLDEVPFARNSGR